MRFADVTMECECLSNKYFCPEHNATGRGCNTFVSIVSAYSFAKLYM